MGRLWQAVQDGDVNYLAGWISGRQMIDITPEDVARWLPRLKEMEGDSSERFIRNGKMFWPFSDGFIDLYFRARMSQDGKFVAGASPPPDIHVPVELHVGFLCLEETAEMLENLRRNPEPETKKGPSTPGIEIVMTSPEPIDRTAARVVDNKG